MKTLRRSCWIPAIFIALSLRTALSAEPQQTPVLPCEGRPQPAYAAPGGEPNRMVWEGDGASAWVPPPCSDWSGSSKEIIAIAGSFRSDSSLDALLWKLGAISDYPSIVYWSVTEKKWHRLVAAATALTSPHPSERRADLRPQDMTKGATFYLWEREDRTGPVIYRLSVRDRTDDRVVLETVNVTPIKFHIVPLMRAGTLQTLEYVQRIAPDTWGVYIVTRTTKDAGLLAGDQQASYVNRSVALFRRLAGIPMDREPPAAH